MRAPSLTHCTSRESVPADYPLDDLYRATKDQKAALRAMGYTDIRQIPPGLLKTDRQRRIRQAALDGRPYLDDEAGRKLRAAPYPRHYFDFETLSVGLPVWPGTGPHMVIPFQWSCDVERAPGVIEQGHTWPAAMRIRAAIVPKHSSRSWVTKGPFTPTTRSSRRSGCANWPSSFPIWPAT